MWTKVSKAKQSDFWFPDLYRVGPLGWDSVGNASDHYCSGKSANSGQLWPRSGITGDSSKDPWDMGYRSKWAKRWGGPRIVGDDCRGDLASASKVCGTEPGMAVSQIGWPPAGEVKGGRDLPRNERGAGIDDCLTSRGSAMQEVAHMEFYIMGGVLCSVYGNRGQKHPEVVHDMMAFQWLMKEAHNVWGRVDEWPMTKVPREGSNPDVEEKGEQGYESLGQILIWPSFPGEKLPVVHHPGSSDGGKPLSVEMERESTERRIRGEEECAPMLPL